MKILKKSLGSTYYTLYQYVKIIIQKFAGVGAEKS